MYKPVKFITKIPYKDFSTYYLFCKNTKILLPIEIENIDSGTQVVPSIYNSIKRILIGSGIFVKGIKIYRQSQNNFYTYITIKNKENIIDVNIGFTDGIKLAKEMSVPIYVSEKILDEFGLKITSDLISKALRY